MRQKTLTPRHPEVLLAIRVLSAKGQPPTLDEIGAHVKMRSLKTVLVHLDKLERKGFLIRPPRMPRSIKLLPQAFAIAA